MFKIFKEKLSEKIKKQHELRSTSNPKKIEPKINNEMNSKKEPVRKIVKSTERTRILITTFKAK